MRLNYSYLRRRISWRLLPLVFCIGLLVFLWRGLSLQPQLLPSVMIAKSLPNFKWRALDPNSAPLTPQVFRGQVSLLNIWASWCASCAEEQVFLMRLANQGIVIYGLNYKDDATKARTWLAEWGNPYTAIGVDPSGHEAMALGVYGTPETFLIDAAGVVRYRYVGPLNLQVWQTVFLPKIHELLGQEK